MTTFALIAGMMPIAIGAGEGADFRAPLGRAVIGGVITSTILTLLVIPTFYEILTDWRDWLSAKLTGKAPVAHGHTPRRRRRRARSKPTARHVGVRRLKDPRMTRINGIPGAEKPEQPAAKPRQWTRAS